MPNTTLVLYSVPFDIDYNHVRLFNTSQEQSTYFSSIQRHVITNLSFIKNTNRIRIEITYNELLQYNYLSFANNPYTNKTFYAFIVARNYINDNTFEIEYTIDVFQTYFLSCTVKPCFVEREHSESDEAGENIVEEGLEIGQYIVSDVHATGVTVIDTVVLGCTFDDTFTDIQGAVYNNIYSGLMYHDFPLTTTGITLLEDFIHDATVAGKSSGIVTAFLFPSSFVTQIGGSSTTYTVSLYKKQAGTITDSSGSSYTPKNKKLFTYPYCFLYVSNLQGQTNAFPVEYFSSNRCEFTLMCDYSPVATPFLVPANYKGQLANFDELLSLPPFPQVSFNIDSFLGWLHNYLLSFGANSLTSSVTSLAAGTPWQGVLAQGAISALQSVGQITANSTAPMINRGSSSSSTFAGVHATDFLYCYKHITPQYAKVIDNYFSKFGYRTNLVKIPNLYTRTNWNFVKTSDCLITGNCDYTALKTMQDCFNKGITLWHTNDIGNYSLSNEPGEG